MFYNVGCSFAIVRFNSVPDIKQQDWLDGVDMVAMPMTSQERKQSILSLTRILHFGAFQVSSEFTND